MPQLNFHKILNIINKYVDRCIWVYIYIHLIWIHIGTYMIYGHKWKFHD